MPKGLQHAAFCATTVAIVLAMPLAVPTAWSAPHAVHHAAAHRPAHKTVSHKATAHKPVTHQTAHASQTVQKIVFNGAYLHGKPVQQVIFNLSKNATDVKTVEQADATALTFPGILPANLRSGTSKNFDFPNLQQVYFNQAGGRVQVFIKRRVAQSVDVHADHNRVVVNVPVEFTKILESAHVAPGVTHTKIVQAGTRGPLLINVLAVDPDNPGVEIFPALANGHMGSKGRVRDIVAENGGIAGVNASFFKQDKGIPLGTMIIGNELIAGPLFNRVAMGIAPDNHLELGRVGLFGNVRFTGSGNEGQRISIDNINQPRVHLDQTVLYTSRWGSTAPAVPKDGYQIQLTNNHVTGISQSAPLAIPKDGYVLSGPNSAEMTALAHLSWYQNAQLSFYTLPDWSGMKHAVSGGPYLVKNGQVYVDAQAQNFGNLGTYAPRTAAGITKNGKLLLVTVDGRQKNVSVGVSLTEMAQLMKHLGAYNAMNLDGGSSTQMVVNGRLVDSPSVANGAAVSSCLVIKESGVRTGTTTASADSSDTP